MEQTAKFKDLLANSEKYIQEMVGFTDKKLVQNLNLVRDQMKMCKPENEAGMATLQEMENQIIEARARKF